MIQRLKCFGKGLGWWWRFFFLKATQMSLLKVVRSWKVCETISLLQIRSLSVAVLELLLT